MVKSLRWQEGLILSVKVEEGLLLLLRCERIIF